VPQESSYSCTTVTICVQNVFVVYSLCNTSLADRSFLYYKDISHIDTVTTALFNKSCGIKSRQSLAAYSHSMTYLRTYIIIECTDEYLDVASMTKHLQ